jgi:hypothetical protein
MIITKHEESRDTALLGDCDTKPGYDWAQATCLKNSRIVNLLYIYDNSLQLGPSFLEKKKRETSVEWGTGCNKSRLIREGFCYVYSIHTCVQYIHIYISELFQPWEAAEKPTTTVFPFQPGSRDIFPVTCLFVQWNITFFSLMMFNVRFIILLENSFLYILFILFIW